MKTILKLSILLALSALLIASCSKDESLKKGNSLKEVDDVCTVMEDSNFMKFCYDNYDVNHDGKVSMQEAAAAKRMDISGEGYSYAGTGGIHSMKGVEYFTGLTYLSCQYQNAGGAMDLSRCSELEYLNCSDCEVTNLYSSFASDLGGRPGEV